MSNNYEMQARIQIAFGKPWKWDEADWLMARKTMRSVVDTLNKDGWRHTNDDFTNLGLSIYINIPVQIGEDATTGDRAIVANNVLRVIIKKLERLGLNAHTIEITYPFDHNTGRSVTLVWA